jgi:hypothetical protein
MNVHFAPAVDDASVDTVLSVEVARFPAVSFDNT